MFESGVRDSKETDKEGHEWKETGLLECFRKLENVVLKKRESGQWSQSWSFE